MPVGFSTRCSNSDYFGFAASPEAIVAAAKQAEEVGFDAIFVNDHIIVDGSPPRSIVDQHFGIRSLRCRSLQRTRCLGSGLWRRAAQGCRLSRPVAQTLSRGSPSGAVGHIVTEKGLSATGADSPYEEGGV